MSKKKDAPTSWRTKMRLAHNIEKSHPDGAKKLRKQAAAQRKRERTNAAKKTGKRVKARVASVSRKLTRKSRSEPVTHIEAALLGLPFVERPKTGADVERRKSLQREGSAAADGWTVERKADGQMMATHSSAPEQTQLERNLLRMFGEAWSHMTPESCVAAEIQMKAVMEIAEATGRSLQSKRDANMARIRTVAGFLAVMESIKHNHDRSAPTILSPAETEAIVETLRREGYRSNGYSSPWPRPQPETDNAKS